MTRNICTLLFSFFSIITYAQDVADPDPKRFQKQIDEFDSLDRLSPPEKGGVLFLGSSSIRMWKSAKKKFAKYGAINRGFGGSQTSDAIHYFDELVVPYAPAKIVFYEGDNDTGAGKSPEQILADFKEFVEMMEEELPAAQLGFVAIKPSPRRYELLDKMRVANQVIRAYCDTKDNLYYIDVFEPMMGKDGRPKPQIFTQDSLHMNEKGYKIWNKEVKPFLKK